MKTNVKQVTLPDTLLNSKVPDDSLQHYGKLGMKWGIRNSRGGYERTGAGKKGTFKSDEDIAAAKSAKAANKIAAKSAKTASKAAAVTAKQREQQTKNAARIKAAQVKLETTKAKTMSIETKQDEARAKNAARVRAAQVKLETSQSKTADAAAKNAARIKKAQVKFDTMSSKAKAKALAEQAKSEADKLKGKKLSPEEKRLNKASAKYAKERMKSDAKALELATKQEKAKRKDAEDTAKAKVELAKQEAANPAIQTNRITSNLSDQELNARINRIRNEATYKDLTTPKTPENKAVTLGKKYAGMFGDKVASKSIEKVTNYGVVKVLEKTLNIPVDKNQKKNDNN